VRHSDINGEVLTDSYGQAAVLKKAAFPRKILDMNMRPLPDKSGPGAKSEPITVSCAQQAGRHPRTAAKICYCVDIGCYCSLETDRTMPSTQ
jgi:hypothetical protein